MDSLLDLKETLDVIYVLFKDETEIKLEPQFSSNVQYLKSDFLRNLLSHLILEKKNYIVESMIINEKIQLLYISKENPKIIDEEFQKKYILENKIDHLAKKIETIKNLF
jgi:hypothetical protein